VHVSCRCLSVDMAGRQKSPHADDRSPLVQPTGKMPSAWVRALCAQIAIELDPQKLELLTSELAEILLREYLSCGILVDQELTSETPDDKN